MRTRDRVAARFYKSSDRTHITKIRWTKKEREQWAQEQRDAAARMWDHMHRGDERNALVTLLQIVRLEAVGIHTLEALEARNEFVRRCTLRVEVKLEGNVQFKPECIVD